MIGIVDYEAGNLNSVQKAFDFLEKESKILKSPEGWGNIQHLVLPGVGSFGFAMQRIQEKKMKKPLIEWIESGRPFLGICLGFQLLFESSEEFPGIEGLSIFKGTCRRFTGKKVPQIGWNDIHVARSVEWIQEIGNGEFFYFNHSYYVVAEEEEVVVATSCYNVEFTCIAGKGKVYGVQFHPEKSGRTGLKLLQNWAERC